MNNMPHCPYCGTEMEFSDKEDIIKANKRDTCILYQAWYSCPKCLSRSPLVNGRWGGSRLQKQSEALSAALNLTIPSRLISEEDLDELGIIYLEASFCKGSVQRVLWESENEDAIRFNVGGGSFQELNRVDYGRTWRCWTTHPSKEEMENTPWEE